MNKEKTPLLVFYRNGDNGTIAVEFATDLNNIQLEQQLIGSVEVYLGMMKKDMADRLTKTDDDTERSFTN